MTDQKQKLLQYIDVVPQIEAENKLNVTVKAIFWFDPFWPNYIHYIHAQNELCGRMLFASRCNISMSRRIEAGRLNGIMIKI